MTTGKRMQGPAKVSESDYHNGPHDWIDVCRLIPCTPMPEGGHRMFGNTQTANKAHHQPHTWFDECDMPPPCLPREEPQP